MDRAQTAVTLRDALKVAAVVAATATLMNSGFPGPRAVRAEHDAQAAHQARDEEARRIAERHREAAERESRRFAEMHRRAERQHQRLEASLRHGPPVPRRPCEARVLVF